MPNPIRLEEEVSNFTRLQEQVQTAPSSSIAPRQQQMVSMNVETVANVPGFGTYPKDQSVNPSDTVLFDVYSYTGVYLESDFSITDFTSDGPSIAVFNVTGDLERLQYVNGKFQVQYKFLRNILGAGNGQRMTIVELSSDRLEARVIPTANNTAEFTAFKNYFQQGVFNLDKSKVLPSLRLFVDSQNSYEVFDYIQDDITYPVAPYSIIIKLSNPLPTTVVTGTQVFLSQQLSTSAVEEVVVLPRPIQAATRRIKGPNFNAADRYTSRTSSPHRSYNELTGSALVSANVINSIFSGSKAEGIPLNIDYRDFGNFIYFGSAYDRLANFEYKIRQIEFYNSRLTTLTTALNGLPSSSATASVAMANNITTTQLQLNNILGSFDGYERYVYYESSSYETSSFGEFYPTTWPKQNATKPYTLYSYTSSEAIDWLNGTMASASLHDDNNSFSLQKTIPAHIQEDETNSQYVLFTNMTGHYFDLVYEYVKQLTYVHDRQESITEGFAKDIIYSIGESLGITFDSGVKYQDLWEYALGTNASGSFIYNSSGSLKDKQLEIWKRVINNLPYLLKTKGTERGLRALINIFGIPSTMLRIREYGGPEATYDTVSDYTYDRFFYALNVGDFRQYNPGYYGTGSYGTNTYGSQSYAISSVQIPWTSLAQSQQSIGRPDTIQLRFKAVSGSNRTQHLIEKRNIASNLDFAVKLDYTNTTSSIQFVLSGSAGYATASVQAPVFDGEWWNFMLRRTGVEVGSGLNNNTYDLMIKQVNYDKVAATYSASVLIVGATSASYNQAYVDAGVLDIAGANLNTSSFFSGSIQEFRYWSVPISESTFNQHTLAPTSYVGNNNALALLNTSSYDTLGARFCFGSDNRKTNAAITTSIASQHPNQDTNIGISASFSGFPTASNSQYISIAESHTLFWPDLSGNRQISNKIRLEDNALIKPTLSRDVKLEVSSNDVYPVDSPRLGLYFSPQDEVNQDIAEQFGASNIDDLIGNPADLSKDSYPGLILMQRAYDKKYKGRNRPGDYLKKVKQIDDAVFRIAKQLVPLRANFQTGIVIEPTILERPKLPTNQPTFADVTYSSSIDTSVLQPTVVGIVSDASGESIAEGYYAFDFEISASVATATGSYEVYSGSVEQNVLTISAQANPYTNTQTFTALVGGTFPEGDATVTDAFTPTQYTYIETIYSGSVWTSSLNAYWQRNPFQPTITSSRVSELFDLVTSNGVTVTVDMFNGSGSFNSSSFSSLTDITNRFGINAYRMQYISADQALVTQTLNTGGTSVASMSITVPGNDGAIYFDASYTTQVSGSAGTNPAHTVTLYSGSTSVFTYTAGTLPTPQTNQTFRTPVGYPADRLEFVFTGAAAADKYVLVDNMTIYIKQKARVSDYNFLYEGKQRQLYKGTQQVSQDFNIDSDDTVDGGPVITVTTVNPNILQQISRTQLGNTNFQVE